MKWSVPFNVTSRSSLAAVCIRYFVFEAKCGVQVGMHLQSLWKGVLPRFLILPSDPSTNYNFK